MTRPPRSIVEHLGAVAVALAKELARAVNMPPSQRAWHLVQRAKMLPGAIEAITADEAILRGAAERFASAAGLSIDELWPSVLLAWHKAHRTPGPLGAALLRAREDPITLHGSAAGAGPLFAELMALAYHLQRAAGGAVIWLPQHDLAALLVVHQTTVSSLLELARGFKLLVRVRKGRFGKQARATTYRFNFAARDVYSPPARDLTNGTDAETPRPQAARFRRRCGPHPRTLNGSGARRRPAVDTSQPDERTRP